MTPKEKSVELVNKFSLVNSKNYIDDNGLWDTEFTLTDDDAKQCALIAVDEIIEVINNENYDPTIEDYWKLVKEEIQKL